MACSDFDVLPCHLVFGATIHGLKLSEKVSKETIAKLRQCVSQHRVVIVKHQGILPADRQIEITQWFGEVEWAGFEQHTKSPHRLILRVSNNEEEGFKDFGTSGFHIDGSFMVNPNNYSLYHIINVPVKGSTVFVALNEVYEGLHEQQKQRWNRLWVMKTFKHIRGYRDKPGYVIHPLVYRHPVTGMMTLFISMGKTYRFIWDKGSPQQKKTDKEETQILLNEIEKELNRDGCSFQYIHEWEAGDFIISDNLAVGHMASPDTQLPPEEVGLRVMHRTVVKGTNRPHKDPRYPEHLEEHQTAPSSVSSFF